MAALVTKNYIDIVSVGDSQAVLATSSQVTCVTSLHNTSNQAGDISVDLFFQHFFTI